jgi:hypothetical protein
MSECVQKLIAIQAQPFGKQLIAIAETGIHAVQVNRYRRFHRTSSGDIMAAKTFQTTTISAGGPFTSPATCTVIITAGEAIYPRSSSYRRATPSISVPVAEDHSVFVTNSDCTNSSCVPATVTANLLPTAEIFYTKTSFTQKQMSANHWLKKIT